MHLFYFILFYSLLAWRINLWRGKIILNMNFWMRCKAGIPRDCIVLYCICCILQDWLLGDIWKSQARLTAEMNVHRSVIVLRVNQRLAMRTANEFEKELRVTYRGVVGSTWLYCIVLYLLPVLNPKSYDGARVLEASGRPMLVIGRSY